MTKKKQQNIQNWAYSLSFSVALSVEQLNNGIHKKMAKKEGAIIPYRIPMNTYIRNDQNRQFPLEQHSNNHCRQDRLMYTKIVR